MTLDDTIAAIATPRGEGGIGIVRISGALAIPIACRLFKSPRSISPSEFPTHTLNYGHIVDPVSEDVVDEVMVSLMRSPKSYTTEDVVEFNCHGGIVPLQRVLELTLQAGARLAAPGEFTKRAFLNGRIDLAQAEAVVEVIRSKTDLARRVAIDGLTGKLSREVNALSDRMADLLAEVEASVDFPDEDLDFMATDAMLQTAQLIRSDLAELLATASEGKILREGISVAIVGKPNVGKSSLLNALLQADRAIVTDIPGTTRDTIEESLNLEGIPIKLVDTAGIHETADTVERQGVERSRTYLDSADLVLMMFDASQALEKADFALLHEANTRRRAILILNKVDLPIVTLPTDLSPSAPQNRMVQTSVLFEQGIEELKSVILQEVLGDTFQIGESPIVTNVRHYDALRRAQLALDYAIDSLQAALSPEFTAVDLRSSLDCIGEIVGKTTTDDILERIFAQFCVGK